VNRYSVQNAGRLVVTVESLSLCLFCLKEAQEHLKAVEKGQNVPLKNLVALVKETPKISAEEGSHPGRYNVTDDNSSFDQ
jgi:hypothetical protein